jgi:ribosome maturation factor RimP
MGSGDEDRLEQVVSEVTTAAGYDLEELVVRAAGRRRVVRVIIDRDGGVTLDAAAEISRAISQRLDETGDDDPTGTAPYTLEVTSPGIGRPLTLPRHFRRARTRLVLITTTAGKDVTGHVLGINDTGVQLVLSGGAGRGGQKEAITQIDVPFADIDRARVEVEFSRPPAAVLAMLGVDPTAEPDEIDIQDDDEDDEDIDNDETDEETEENIDTAFPDESTPVTR